MATTLASGHNIFIYDPCVARRGEHMWRETKWVARVSVSETITDCAKLRVCSNVCTIRMCKYIVLAFAIERKESTRDGRTYVQVASARAELTQPNPRYIIDNYL